jgi:hypothetical protein
MLASKEVIGLLQTLRETNASLGHERWYKMVACWLRWHQRHPIPVALDIVDNQHRFGSAVESGQKYMGGPESRDHAMTTISGGGQSKVLVEALCERTPNLDICSKQGSRAQHDRVLWCDLDGASILLWHIHLNHSKHSGRT